MHDMFLWGGAAPLKRAQAGKAAPDISVEWGVGGAPRGTMTNRPRIRSAWHGNAVPGLVFLYSSDYSVHPDNYTAVLEHKC